ncbi:hypothetical protein CHUAL_005271 [Chamberlinius hualienensis]
MTTTIPSTTEADMVVTETIDFITAIDIYENKTQLITPEAVSAFFPTCVHVGCSTVGLVCDLHTKTCRQQLLDDI